MPNAAKDAFTLGFLTRCAEEGLVGADLDARLEKLAAFNEKAANLGDMSRAALNLAAVPVGLSAVGGGLLGYGAAKLTQPKLDEDEMKTQELVNTYKVLAARARSRSKMRGYRPA